MIKHIYETTQDVNLLSYTMDAVLDTAFPLAYRDQVLRFILPLFPSLSSENKSPHVYSVTRLLVTLSSAELTVPLLNSLVPKDSLLAYQMAFDLVEGGAQDYLESIRKELPEGEGVRVLALVSCTGRSQIVRTRKQFTTSCDEFYSGKSLSSSTSSSSSVITRLTCLSSRTRRQVKYRLICRLY